MGVKKRRYPRNLAKKLKKVREQLGMSQTEIARAIGIENRAQISAFENGTRDAPLDVLLEYARLINSCMDVIVDDRLKLSDHCPKK